MSDTLAMRRRRPMNRWGCKPVLDSCVAHDSLLLCAHGCKHALAHGCQDLPHEEWRLIPGFPNYAASNLGRIRSLGLTGRRCHRARVLAQNTYKGHQYVELYLHGEPHHMHVGRAVLLAFVGSPMPEQQAAHLNGNPQDNQPSNLVWATAAVNAGHRDLHGRTQRGERHARASLTEEGVRLARILHGLGVSWRKVAARIGVSESAISGVLSYRTWKHIWSRAEIQSELRVMTREQRDVLLSKKLETSNA